MLTAQYTEPHSVKAVEADMPTPAPGEALIRVSGMGMAPPFKGG